MLSGVIVVDIVGLCTCGNLICYRVSKHLGKRVTQTCMFTLFFEIVVVRKEYCLPTSYQNVGVISLITTCLQSFIHPSI